MGQNVENNTYDRHSSDIARIKCVFNMWKSIGQLSDETINHIDYAYRRLLVLARLKPSESLNVETLAIRQELLYLRT
jgi:hypothetical protein